MLKGMAPENVCRTSCCMILVRSATLSSSRRLWTLLSSSLTMSLIDALTSSNIAAARRARAHTKCDTMEHQNGPFLFVRRIMRLGPRAFSCSRVGDLQKTVPRTCETCCVCDSCSTTSASSSQKASCTKYTKSTNSFHVSYCTSGVTSSFTVWIGS